MRGPVPAERALTPDMAGSEVFDCAPRDDRAVSSAKRVLVLGSGFAGLGPRWVRPGGSTNSAGREATSTSPSSVRSPTTTSGCATTRPTSAQCRIPLRELLDPAGIAHISADVTGIDAAAATVSTADGTTHGYDRLVLAVGSRVAKPDLPGLAEFAFDVDTYDGAMALQAHIRSLEARDPASATAVVVGAGLTGIETASELPAMLSDALGRCHADGDPRRPQPVRRFRYGRFGSTGDRRGVGRQQVDTLTELESRPSTAECHTVGRAGHSCGDVGVVRRNAGQPVDRAVRIAVRPARPAARRRLPEGRRCRGRLRRR